MRGIHRGIAVGYSTVPVDPVLIPIVCQNMVGVVYIPLTIYKNREIGTWLPYFLGISGVSFSLDANSSSKSH